jgi:hypothetical protein
MMIPVAGGFIGAIYSRARTVYLVHGCQQLDLIIIISNDYKYH